jgi:hypothetical protein
MSSGANEVTIWEKAILNIQKGVQKTNAAAAVFSERMKVEISLARLRIRINEIQLQIDELHRVIGRKIVDLKNSGELPKTSEQLLKDEEIILAMNDLVQCKKDIEDLKEDMNNEQEALRPVKKQGEDSSI